MIERTLAQLAVAQAEFADRHHDLGGLRLIDRPGLVKPNDTEPLPSFIYSVGHPGGEVTRAGAEPPPGAQAPAADGGRSGYEATPGPHHTRV
ncbi:MAG: hypothetical protein J2P20_06305 [Pseudonocardia sp.]|nr:hypothetical protein [Pseudonocardia sp.]